MERASVARLPLRWGNVEAYCYRSLLDGMEHIAMVKVSFTDILLLFSHLYQISLSLEVKVFSESDTGYFFRISKTWSLL